MKVIVSGHGMDVGDSLRNHIEESVIKHVKKYFENAVTATVTLTKTKHQFFKTDVFVNEGTGNGVIIKSSSEDQEPYHSFDLAIQKVEKQLSRYKTKIKNHHKHKHDKVYQAFKYVMQPTTVETQEEANEAPVIIAEKPTDVERMSVSDAVMRMDLLDLPALMFINSKNEKMNVVYYRKDGNISWVDLQNA